jgi:hypothetical protein
MEGRRSEKPEKMSRQTTGNSRLRRNGRPPGWAWTCRSSGSGGGLPASRPLSDRGGRSARPPPAQSPHLPRPSGVAAASGRVCTSAAGGAGGTVAGMKTPWDALIPPDDPAPLRHARPLRQTDLDLYTALVGCRPVAALTGASAAGADLPPRVPGGGWGGWSWRGVVDRLRDHREAVAVRLDPAGRVGAWLSAVRSEAARRWAEARDRLRR